MTNFALPPPPRRIARRSDRRREQRRLETDAGLISVAGVVGSRVVDSSGRHVGKPDDLVVRWDPRDRSVGSSLALRSQNSGLSLHHTFSMQPVARKPWLVALTHDVLDRQIVESSAQRR